MDDRIFTTATIIICNELVDNYVPFFNELRIEKQHMLVNSVVHSADHPIYVRHWTNAEDAQAWADTILEFAAEYTFDVKSSIAPI